MTVPRPQDLLATYELRCQNLLDQIKSAPQATYGILQGSPLRLVKVRACSRSLASLHPSQTRPRGSSQVRAATVPFMASCVLDHQLTAPW